MGHFSKDKLDALQNEACEMLRKNPGLSFCAISKQLGLGDNTVRRWYRNDLSSVSNCNAYLYSQRGTKFNLHTGENTFDISKVTGADYLYIASIDSDGGSCKISEIWLE